MQAIGIGLIIGSGVLSASQQKKAAGYQANLYKQEAQQEADAARDREIDRRRRLVAALASQNAEAGALGAAPGVGSRAAIALADAKRAGYESLADRASTNRRALLLKQGARQARLQGNLAAGATLLDTAGKAYGAS